MEEMSFESGMYAAEYVPGDEKYRLFLSSIDGLSLTAVNMLLARFETAENIFKAGEDELRAVEGICSSYVDRILWQRQSFEPEAEEERLAGLGIRYYSRVHPEYPKRLACIEDAPAGIFCIGKLPDSTLPAIAIVGSRVCGTYGRELSLKFAKQLAGAGVDIISGMAAGVDGFSHRGALNGGGRTYAVLGCGVDICYPAGNRDIYERIRGSGGIISEYYPGTAPASYNFPRRNRIISALSDGILVVEARERSGTWITVEMGLEQGKDIYAIPGRIGDELSIGCNRLIRQGARLVTCPEDIIVELAPHYGYFVNRSAADGFAGSKRRSPSGLSASEKRVLKKLEFVPKSTDELAALTGMTITELLTALTMLELKGFCARVDRNMYAALP